ncbi:FecR family protein [Parabacteroides sp. OttesenSCG-928-G06]|nr:FecR family protein [Parabacteroides sp. OttesenSCG-928-G06]
MLYLKNDTYKKYNSMAVEELLQDDYFIASRLYPTRESERFWNNILQEGLIRQEDYNLACFFINSVQMDPETLSPSEKTFLWKAIGEDNQRMLKKKKKRTRILLSSLSGIAASLALFLLVYTNQMTNQMPEIEGSRVSIEDIKAPKTPVTDIQLILADNETVSLEGQEANIAYKEGEIAINDQTTNITKEECQPDQPVIYNQLIVPHGKRSMLTFAEGSKIWVNAGTRVVYPTTFSPAKREIYVDGEVYLDIAPMEDCPFIVKTKELNIEVMGTTFNVFAFDKDTVQSIVLVSGKVKVESEESDVMILSPNEMLTKSSGVSQVRTVDVDDYISWKAGVFKCRNESLIEVLGRLSEYYGEDISCSASVAGIQCRGKLDLLEDFESMLKGIAKSIPISYRYNEGKYEIANK